MPQLEPKVHSDQKATQRFVNVQSKVRSKNLKIQTKALDVI